MKWLDRILRGSDAPVDPPRGDPARIAEVERVLARIKPLLAQDGGDVRLIAVEEDDVILAWSGACRSCASQADTLRAGIEPTLKRDVTWIASVRAAS